MHAWTPSGRTPSEVMLEMLKYYVVALLRKHFLFNPDVVYRGGLASCYLLGTHCQCVLPSFVISRIGTAVPIWPTEGLGL